MKKSELRQIIREEIQKLREGQVKIWKSPQGVLRRNKDWTYSIFKSMEDLDANKPVVANLDMDELAEWGQKNKKQFKAMGLSGFTESKISEASFKNVSTKVHDFMDDNKLEHGETNITNTKIEIDAIHKEKHADKIIEFLKTLMPFQGVQFVKKQHLGKWYIWIK